MQLWILALFSALSGASPVTTAKATATLSSPPAGGSTEQACAIVSASSASQIKTNPSAFPTVDAAIAYECLNSVPLHKSDAQKLVNDVVPYLKWQSTTSYLKDPPHGYLGNTIDLFAELNTVLAKIGNGTYANEYQFQADLFRIFNAAQDGHLAFTPDLLGAALSFSRGLGLVSVSLNGQDLPAIYTHGDMESYVDGHKNVSSIKTINGQDAAEYLKELASLNYLQDPDASYNTMFYSRPFSVYFPGWEGYFAGNGNYGMIFPGLNTTIDFQNGTTRTLHTISNVIGDFTGVTDGDSMYAKFCSGEPGAIEPPPPTTVGYEFPSSTAYVPITSPTVEGYPPNVITVEDSAISGYYLTGANSDVAVLSILLIEGNVSADFQSLIQDFIADCKKTGKTKLVIDLSANFGGFTLQAYDTFRQLFPQIVQDGYTRVRSSDSFQAIAVQYEQALQNISPNKSATYDQFAAYMSEANWRYPADFNLTNQPFTSEQSKVGPYVYNGDNFTNILRHNLNDPLISTNDTYGLGIEITGYGNRKNFTQPFAAEDIVILQDGFCASACTIFSEFLTTQAGVKSIAIGGRPSKAGMQAIGGTKGTDGTNFEDTYTLAQVALDSMSESQKNSSHAKILEEFSLYPYYRSISNGLNLRDNILPANLKDGIPAQFVYQKADCRIFYQPQMIMDVTAMWEMAANVAWGNATCVEGDLGLQKRTLVPEQIVDRSAPVKPISRPARDFSKAPGTTKWAASGGGKVRV